MASSAQTLSPPPAARRKVEWMRAWRAIRKLVHDPKGIDQAFELVVSLDGGDSERLFQAFLAEPGGPALLAERPLLLDHLADFETLRRLPEESLGRAYLDLMESNGYAADSLRRASEKIKDYGELYTSEERTWLAQRNNCVHDLLHVVTSYGQDPAGEMANLWFSCSIYHNSRVDRFTMWGSLPSAPLRSWPRTFRFMIRAWQRGNRAHVPLSYRWEQALPRPLEEVRRDLRIEPVEVAHPKGILRGDLEESGWPYQPARW